MDEPKIPRKKPPTTGEHASECTSGAGDIAPKDGKMSDRAIAEIGGRTGPEPTRYNDWEVNGICVDF